MWTKQIEKRGKRALIGLACRLVRTAPISSQEIRDSRPRRILVVRQHNQMGDMLLATPAYRAIKESLENVRLGVVAARFNRNVLLNHPFVDEVFTYNNRDNLLMEVQWLGRNATGEPIYTYSGTGTRRVFAYNDPNASSGSGDYVSYYTRLSFGAYTALEPTSLGRVKSMYR